PIPEFPYRIGIITSSTGAAIEDIRKIITAKNDFTDILIFPTLVQGVGAARSICSNIEKANKLAREGLRIDTLIVGRGGGSPEDLAAFNDEDVCRAIFASEIPVISAVGHESDFSISDMVADVRAETPTAAADMAVMNSFELRDAIEIYKQQLIDSAGHKTESERQILLSRSDLLLANIKSRISEAASLVDKSIILLKENNPANVFSKGYAAVTDEKGQIIPDVNGIKSGGDYIITMSGGSFTATATDVRKDD
ncbi:MAG: exodeoxyribonuclease VII large subunit, partial [Mogibacterium sp.]|nr:exodeoxyribonuclease VII large subunit [Mogibacterium sp.]